MAGPELNPTSPTEISARSAQHLSKIAASWKLVQRWAARRELRCAAPAPCRRSDNFPAHREQFPDASDKRIPFLMSAEIRPRERAPAPFHNPDTAADLHRREPSPKLPDASDMCTRHRCSAEFSVEVTCRCALLRQSSQVRRIESQPVSAQDISPAIPKTFSRILRCKSKKFARCVPPSPQRAPRQPAFHKLYLVRILPCRPSHPQNITTNAAQLQTHHRAIPIPP